MKSYSSQQYKLASTHTPLHIYPPCTDRRSTSNHIKPKHQIPPNNINSTKMAALKNKGAWRLSQLFVATLGLICVTGLLLATPSAAAGGPYSYSSSSSPNNAARVRLADVQTLTLYAGKMTAGRRSSPVPHANCIGGTAQGKYTPSTIQCTNKGWDGVDAQWECKADLDNAYRFGETTVVCEGYDHPEDPYILAGSCGVEYTLEFTQEGLDIEKAKANSRGGYQYQSSSSTHQDHATATATATAAAELAAVVGWIIFAILLCACAGGASNQTHHHTAYHHTAPPAYNSGGCYNTGGYGNGYSSSSGNGFWPGFVGFVGGAAVGSAFSRPSLYTTRSSSSSGGGGGWGGRSSSRSSASTSSSGTRTASGFGGTRRR